MRVDPTAETSHPTNEKPGYTLQDEAIIQFFEEKKTAIYFPFMGKEKSIGKRKGNLSEL